MTKHQAIAIHHHCRFAFETAQPQFCYVILGGRISIVLTVNSGYE
jgi:hypothetical protein